MGDIVMKLKTLILLVVGISVFASTPSWAGGHRQANLYATRHQCKAMVDAKGLKGAAWKAEYGKCTEVGAADYQ